MRLAAENPDLGPGDIATRVEASGAPPGFYGQWAGEAQTILDAWGGNIGVSGVGRVRVKEEPFNFTVAKGESYFDAAGRLAQEVRWRFWVDQNQAWYAPDDWLFQSATTLQISPGMQGFRGIDGTNDVGIPIGELVIQASVPRWVGEPAWRVEIDDMGPLNGLWLLANHQQDLFTEDSTITLHRPAPKLKEPAATKRIRTIAPSDTGVPLEQVRLRGVDQPGVPYWAGTLSIFTEFVTPFMAGRSLSPGSTKRTPQQNADDGGSSTSDHLTTETRAYATDYPTFDGKQIASDLATEMGFSGWRENSYTPFSITVKGIRFRVQILWGAQIQHADHVHVGIKRA